MLTAGVGENDAVIRARLCQGAAWLGIEIDSEANSDGRLRISPPGKYPAVWVIPTDEERMIAEHTRRLAERAPQ